MIQRSKHGTKLFKLFKWILLILLILCIVIYFLIQGIKTYSGFQGLENDSVEHITIYKFNANSFNHQQDSLVLSKKQINNFVRKWNTSYPIGPCKYIPSFTLTVKMKNGQVRDFRTCGGTIKEDNGYGYKFLFDKNFFESTWNGK